MSILPILQYVFAILIKSQTHVTISLKLSYSIVDLARSVILLKSQSLLMIFSVALGRDFTGALCNHDTSSKLQLFSTTQIFHLYSDIFVYSSLHFLSLFCLLLNFCSSGGMVISFNDLVPIHSILILLFSTVAFFQVPVISVPNRQKLLLYSEYLSISLSISTLS